MDTTKRTFGPIEYYLSGDSPEFLLLSGMHGNEHDVIGCLADVIKNISDKLPNFLYIPHVSPSAVSAGTRLNGFGHDINRSFLSPAPDSESAACMDLLSQYSFRISLDFHEDPDRNTEFYLYDSGRMSEDELRAYRTMVSKTGAKLYSGLDDDADPTLGYRVDDGYVSIHHELSAADTGFSTGWLLRHAVVRRAYTFEIPGKSDVALKKTLVSALVPYFMASRHDTI